MVTKLPKKLFHTYLCSLHSELRLHLLCTQTNENRALGVYTVGSGNRHNKLRASAVLPKLNTTSETNGDQCDGRDYIFKVSYSGCGKTTKTRQLGRGIAEMHKEVDNSHKND